MANTFYTAAQVARTAVALTAQDAFLSQLVSRNFEDDLFAGGGLGRTVNIRIPAALIARERGIDETTAAIVLDSLTETTVPLTLGTHVYSAVGLSEGDITLNLADFTAQVLAPQAEAVVDRLENTVATALRAIPLNTTLDWDAANPVKTFTQIRKTMRDAGVPATGLNVVVGTSVYAALLDAKAITDASESGSTEALRDAGVGKIRGFNIVESTRVDDGEIIAFHRDAFTLATRAPLVPAGASFGETVSEKGFSLRYIRDYDVMHTQDRSLVSTFAGVAALPLYKVTRDYTGNTASVTAVPNAGSIRMSIEDAEA
jgi:hypothetical protein